MACWRKRLVSSLVGKRCCDGAGYEVVGDLR